MRKRRVLIDPTVRTYCFMWSHVDVTGSSDEKQYYQGTACQIERVARKHLFFSYFDSWFSKIEIDAIWSPSRACFASEKRSVFRIDGSKTSVTLKVIDPSEVEGELIVLS